jgi:hypothetical protein
MVGVVNVLFVNVSVPPTVANVPVVGNVTLVAAVNVLVYAKLPADVTVAKALLLTPVPPLVGDNVPITELTELLDTFTKSEPFHTQRAASSFKIVTPVVGPAPRKTMLCVPAELFKTTYAFDRAGAVMFLVTVPFAVHNNMALRASLVTPLAEDNVTSASADSVVVDATASSSNVVILLFTVSPHVPDNSPVAGSASPKSDVYPVAMFKLLFVYQCDPQAV